MVYYLKVEYGLGTHPRTNYPCKLASYLFKRYEMRRGDFLLEAGCGRGEFLREFQALGLNCSGLDSSPVAGEYAPNVEIKRADVETEGFPYLADQFDFVFSKSLMEHLVDPEGYMREVYRVLKPGGMCISMIPDWEANMKIYFDDVSHKTPFTLVSLQNLYLMSDFTDISVQKFRQLPLVWKHPYLNYLCLIVSPFVPARTNLKILRWSRELQLLASGSK